MTTQQEADAELRAYAESVRRQHDPRNQDHHYERCELCGFTRHPCVTYELADEVIKLLDRLDATSVGFSSDRVFVCPRCGAVSHNPQDVKEGYCGRCHDWTGM
jgi:hypothetical protein